MNHSRQRKPTPASECAKPSLKPKLQPFLDSGVLEEDSEFDALAFQPLPNPDPALDSGG
jgi:hypothetical protein